MKRITFKSLILFAIYSVTSCVSASLITVDLLSPSTSSRVNYHNPFKNTFSSYDDGFQIYNRSTSNNIATSFLDDSLADTSDRLGVINSSNQKNFFGIVDTVNPDNLANYASASWQIDISNLTSLLFVTDIAAMGDFETSDHFWWQYSIDANPFTKIFESSTDEDSAENYQLENNTLVSLNDPLIINSRLLNNKFQHFSSPLVGNGKVLTLTLNAKFNGANEVVAFQNVNLKAQANSINVQEPSSLMLCVIAFGLAIVKLSH